MIFEKSSKVERGEMKGLSREFKEEEIEIGEMREYYGYLNYVIENRVCYIMDINIYKEYRSKGKGTWLIEKLIEKVRERCDEIRLETSNPVMERICEKLGFIRTGIEGDLGREYVKKMFGFVW